MTNTSDTTQAEHTNELAYGYDPASPTGDYSALTIRYKGNFYNFVGDEVDAILAYTNKRIEEVLDRLPLDCSNCGRRTLVLEARLRNFNTGMCGACGADALVTGFWAIEAERQKLKEGK